jgi:GAF domain-containing protein
MKNFLRSIWPNTIPVQIKPEDEIAVLRERILQSFCLISIWVGIAVLILILPTYIQLQRWGLIGVYFGCLFSMIAVTFIRRIPYLVRSSVVLVVVFAIALGSLLVYGLSGNGPVLLIGFVALCAIFLGARPGIGAALIAFGTMAAVGFMMVYHYMPLPPIEVQANAANLSDWINRTLVVTLLAIIFTISLAVLVKGLRQALSEQRQIGIALSQERNLLEERVAERTSELERRAYELETASKIARNISHINDLDELLDRAVDLIQGEYHLYHAGIYLIESHQEYASLRGGSGEAGRTMMAMSFRLPLSDTNLVAQAIKKNEVHLTQDVVHDPLYVANPLLAETRAQLAIPLVAGGKVIGALDAQSNIRRFFKPNDIRSLQITTDQLAVAIEKAITVQMLSSALEEMRDADHRSTHEAWKGFQRTSRRNFSYRVRQGKVEPDPLALFDPSEAIETGKPTIRKLTDLQTGNPYTLLAIPIKSRNLVLGELELRFNSGQLSSNVVDLISSVANRLALAIENARLIEENQIKAVRDQTVSDISAKVRAESDIDQVMRIVAAELGRSLGVSDVIVQLRENER